MPPANLSRGRGFTLLEVLIALLVFAVIAASLAGLTANYTDQARALRDTQLALLLAEHELFRLRIAQRAPEAAFPPPGTTRRRVELAEREWRLQVDIAATEHPQLRRVTVAVGRPEAAPPLVSLQGFIGEH